jgi:hypothetical protein
MLIKVTQSHVDAGVPCDATNCPVALAIRTATGKKYLVGPDYVLPPRKRYPNGAIRLPQKVRGFIERFDANHIVEPFKFELPI